MIQPAVLFLSVLCICYESWGFMDFRFGRSSGGHLGAPEGHYTDEPMASEQWFEQKLDHFNPADLRTWEQRYFVKDALFDFKNQGPVFLFIGGESAANPRVLVRGAWIDSAKQLNALCISLEHRYYGDSRPTEDLSVKNLQYLSSAQALADLANFISAMNVKYRLKKDTRWVVFGGSYAGSLAAWLRLKYPHLVYAAVASSAPLLAKVNFVEYYEVVVNAFREKTGGESCVSVIKEAHKQIVSLLVNNPDILEKEFRVCKSFESASSNDIKNFYHSIANYFARIVQYNEINVINGDFQKNVTVNTACSVLTAPGSEPAYMKLAAFNSILLDNDNETCLDYSYDTMINNFRQEVWSSKGARQWMYQTCTEFGFFQTTIVKDPAEAFGNNVTVPFNIQQCQDVFGKRYTEKYVNRVVDWTNKYYGALDIAVSRVIFVHGSGDPWHMLGITKTKDQNAPAVFIEGTAHCANMFPPADTDIPDLVRARAEIHEILSTWLEEM